jgi:hypothetical protein
VELRHPPVVQERAALHRVAEVRLPAVLRIDVGERGGDARPRPSPCGPCRAATCRRARREAGLCGLDGGTEPGAAGSDHEHVVGVALERLHGAPGNVGE